MEAVFGQSDAANEVVPFKTPAVPNNKQPEEILCVSHSAKGLDAILPVRPNTAGPFKTPARRESAALPQVAGLTLQDATEPGKAPNVARYNSVIKTCSLEVSSASRILGKQAKIDRSGSVFLRSKDDSETRPVLCPQKRQSVVAMSTYSKTSITKKRLGAYKPLQALGQGKFARVRLYQHVTSR